jgi:N-acetylneuraminate synthase
MSNRTFVIAEAGVNHNGSIDLALQLIDVAADAGADAVKFQTFHADLLATARAAKADYQARNTGDDGDQLAMLRRLELTEDGHHLLIARCRERRIRFMSTAFDKQSLAFLGGLGMPAVKVPSGDITCAPLLLQAARLGLPLIVSTGMSTLGDIEDALGVLAFGMTRENEPRGIADFHAAYADERGRRALRERVTLLHCVTQYPAPQASVNLRAMDAMAAAFGLPVGYSDHTLGIDAALAAVARGATVIEKHFTLDRGMPGPDHKASLEPAELRRLVDGIRTIEVVLGDGVKRPDPVELPNIPIGRRGLVAAMPIARGERFTADALVAKRPAVGASPMMLWDLVGRIADRDYATDEPIIP